MNFMKLLGVRGQRSEVRGQTSARSVIGYLLLAAAFLAFASPPACAQITPNNFSAFSNMPTTMPGSSTSNVVSAAVSVRPGKGLALLTHCKGDDVGTGTLVAKFNLTVDGTNWTTTTPLAITNTLNGTNVVIDYKLFTADSLDNVRSIRLQTIQNTATNSVGITNITWSVGSGP